MKGSLDDHKENIINLYVNEKLSLREIADKYNCSDKGIQYLLQKHNVPRRSRSEALKGRVVTEKMRETARRLGKSQVGPKNPTWKGKINRSNGYIAVRLPNHPYASKDGYIMEHRLVMEKVLGRYLSPDEDVHHINENKKDNRPENLEVISRSEHSKLHGNKRVEMGTHNNYIHISKEEIKAAIVQSNSVNEAAEKLNIERSTLYKKIQKLGLKNWYREWRKTV